MARADRDQQSNRTADRAQSAMGGGSSRSGSTGGKVSQDPRAYDRAAQSMAGISNANTPSSPSKPSGGTGTTNGQIKVVGTTKYGAPIYDDGNGNLIADSVDKWKATNERVDAYNKAAREWNASAAQYSLGNLLNNIAPMGF